MQMALVIRDATAADHAAILALNLASEYLLSPMDAAGLAELAAQAAYRRVVEEDGVVIAFLLALREGARYDSPNYLWFAERGGSFLYIDRVVVAGSQRGRGIGQQLYRDLFAFARGQGIATVACEFDLEPLNAGSQRFHAAFGFREVGSQWLPASRKRVSLQTATP
jgi:uncharacterized protein